MSVTPVRPGYGRLPGGLGTKWEEAMEDQKPGTPAEERRGGDKPDWAHAKSGEELPELPDASPETVTQIKPDYDEDGDDAA